MGLIEEHIGTRTSSFHFDQTFILFLMSFVSLLPDTSVLEFCLKLSRSEAETLLIENLGLRDPDHKFIDKFLNYKDLLPSEVVEIAFQSKGSGVGTRNNTGEDYYSNTTAANDGFSKVGGKKKGKKGKKVSLSASVLGFNVVSNRIMMGEIQTIED